MQIDRKLILVQCEQCFEKLNIKESIESAEREHYEASLEPVGLGISLHRCTTFRVFVGENYARIDQFKQGRYSKPIIVNDAFAELD